jgi:hypothetical protein
MSTDVSVEHTAFIFRVEEYAEQETMVTSRATRRYIPEASTFHKHRCENLESCAMGTIFSLVSVSFLTSLLTQLQREWK